MWELVAAALRVWCLQLLCAQKLVETYHGVYVTITYMLTCTMQRRGFSKSLTSELEFIVEVPVRVVWSALTTCVWQCSSKPVYCPRVRKRCRTKL